MAAQVPGMPTIYDLPNGGSSFNQAIGTPRQQELQNQLGEIASQRLANPTQGFDPIAAQSRNEFYTDVIPSLSERFTAMGGGQRSGGFQRAIGRAGSNLESNLAAQRAQYGLQQQGLANQQLNTALQPQYSQAYYQPQDNRTGEQLANILGTSADAYFKAPGDSPLEKLKSVLGIGGKAAETTKAAITNNAAKTAGTTVAQTASDIATPVAASTAGAVGGKALATAAGKVATTNPALASAAAKKAATGTTAAVAAATAAGTALGWEASIAPVLAKVGAVAMPLVAVPLMGWIAYEIIKGIFFED